MAGAKFQYDESGGTSFYFLLSFLALVVIPCTYYFWPKEEKETKEKNRNVCNCDPCSLKLDHIKANEPWKNVKRNLIKILILFGWIVMIATAYKCDHLQNDTVPWDPFQILEIPPGSSTAEIKKAYRKLSLIYHPDKETGSQEHFVKITKAYAALTDETARKNWEQYGNPDGPGATSFGIALPSWIVEKENSLIVLGLYALVFMIALPTVVGIWWYRSIKFNGDQVLLDTSQVYYYFIHKTDNMMVKRIIAVIAASLEFEKNHNSEIIERPTDHKEIMALIKEIPHNLGESNKEKPLCYPYSVKARALIFAHLSRLKLPPKTLEVDKIYIVKKIPTLVQEFVFNVAQLTMLSLAGRIQRMPSLETIENAMKFCAMAVQATWEYRNQLLQLPHINTANLKFFSNKKRTIRTIQQLALLRDEERRSMLSYLSDNQYEDIINVIKKMPLLKVTAKPEVLDDEDTGLITAGAIVTVTVTLERKNMEIYVNKSKNSLNAFNQEENNDEENQLDKANKVSDENEPTQKQKPPVWKKVAKKGKSKGKKKGTIKKMPLTKQSNNQPTKKSDEDSDSSNSNDSENEKEDNNSDVPNQDSKIKKKDKDVDTDEDDDWDKFQEKVLKKDKTLESKPKFSHSVHCPFFYDDKQENWWIYMVDRKRPALVTVPVLMTSLIDYEEIELKFTAPSKPGIYKYEVMVRSDSYVDFLTTVNLKLEVLKEKTYEPPAQWDLSEESEEHSEDDDAVEDSDLLESDNDLNTDSDDSEDDTTVDDSA